MEKNSHTFEWPTNCMMENPFEILNRRLATIETLLTIVLAEAKDNKKAAEEIFLSGKQVCQLFNPKISLPTLKNWSDKGLLIRHTIGNRVWYKKSEVMEAVKSIKKYKVTLPFAAEGLV